MLLVLDKRGCCAPPAPARAGQRATQWSSKPTVQCATTTATPLACRTQEGADRQVLHAAGGAGRGRLRRPQVGAAWSVNQLITFKVHGEQAEVPWDWLADSGSLGLGLWRVLGGCAGWLRRAGREGGRSGDAGSVCNSTGRATPCRRRSSSVPAAAPLPPPPHLQAHPRHDEERRAEGGAVRVVGVAIGGCRISGAGWLLRRPLVIL